MVVILNESRIKAIKGLIKIISLKRTEEAPFSNLRQDQIGLG